jgi:hypothetical protein
MDAVSSVLTVTAAGDGVLKVGGTAKMAGMRACVTVPTDDLAAILARRKCTHSWKSCHSYGDNLYTTQTPECSKGKYNAKIINESLS